MQRTLVFALVLLATFAVVGGGVAAILSGIVSREKPPQIEDTAPRTKADLLEGAVVFNPPLPEDAPPEIRDAVLYGRDLLTDTQRNAKAYVGNKLNCTNCHFDGGRSRDSISLVGVAATYPKYRSRTKYATDLVSRTNECFERSMNGRPLPPNSREMQAINAYYQWISKGLPIYAEVPWLGLKELASKHKPDPGHGSHVYTAKCASCHGADGAGTLIAQAVWGPGSYNDGAGMAKVEMLASFTYHNMPKQAHDLTVDDALDVAAFVDTRPRPHFVAARKPAH
ncbi:MAG TPA: c-type cytochrome [Terracidiphilus sp.]|nr:c-type cytochrome [Terracidiphilus sp.]